MRQRGRRGDGGGLRLLQTAARDAEVAEGGGARAGPGGSPLHPQLPGPQEPDEDPAEDPRGRGLRARRLRQGGGVSRQVSAGVQLPGPLRLRHSRCRPTVPAASVQQAGPHQGLLRVPHHADLPQKVLRRRGSLLGQSDVRLRHPGHRGAFLRPPPHSSGRRSGRGRWGLRSAHLPVRRERVPSQAARDRRLPLPPVRHGGGRGGPQVSAVLGAGGVRRAQQGLPAAAQGPTGLEGQGSDPGPAAEVPGAGRRHSLRRQSLQGQGRGHCE